MGELITLTKLANISMNLIMTCLVITTIHETIHGKFLITVAIKCISDVNKKYARDMSAPKQVVYL